MIFHKKIFQCVTAPIPLFQTPQKIGLLNYPESCIQPIGMAREEEEEGNELASSAKTGCRTRRRSKLSQDMKY